MQVRGRLKESRGKFVTNACHFSCSPPSSMQEWNLKTMTPGKEHNAFQEGKWNAKELAGCSSVKKDPLRCAMAHSVAARSAISVSTWTLLDRRCGVPCGKRSERNGGGDHFAFSMGHSLARVNVLQFRAQCCHFEFAAALRTACLFANTFLGSL
jgi:hypothetical protein